MAVQGLRVLGVAKASLLDAPPPFLPPHPSLSPDHLPDQQHDFPFQFLGLVGLSESRAYNYGGGYARMLHRWALVF